MPPERSDGYFYLAEALSEPPDWLALPGRDWPLTQVVATACSLWGTSNAVQAGLQSALKALEIVQPGSIQDRRAHYQALLSHAGLSGLWMNEAGALTGRMLGDATWDVARWYQSAGLEIPGAEQPDHASVELAFLSHLSALAEEGFQQVEQAFLKQHALCWLPQLGSRLAASANPIYVPIGQTLRAWLALAQEATSPNAPFNDIYSRTVGHALRPSIGPACNLCMACLAACPHEALRIQENAEITRLVLLADTCTGCGQCEPACTQAALQMQTAAASAGHGWQALFTSPRGQCLHCGAPLASQAELQYVSQVLHHPDWLAICPDCR